MKHTITTQEKITAIKKLIEKNDRHLSAKNAKSDNQQWFMIALFAGFFINLMTSAMDSSFQKNLNEDQYRLYGNFIIIFGFVIIFGLAFYVHRYFTKPASEMQRRSDNYYHEIDQLQRDQDKKAS
jgi:Na+/proline symporter